MRAIAGEPSGFLHFVDAESSIEGHTRPSHSRRIANGAGRVQRWFSVRETRHRVNSNWCWLTLARKQSNDKSL